MNRCNICGKHIGHYEEKYTGGDVCEDCQVKQEPAVVMPGWWF